MKRFFYMFLMLCPLCVFATDMCARDGTMVFVFDPRSSSNGYKMSYDGWVWTRNFAFGNIAGEATCVSDAEVANNAMGAGLDGADADGNPRINCYCRMTHPMMSDWVLNVVLKTGCPDCPRRCASTSADTGYVGGYWSKLFDSIGRQ